MKRAAMQRRTEAAITKTLYAHGIEPVKDPAAALMELVSEASAFKRLLEAQIAEMRTDEWRYTSSLGAEQLDSRLALYERSTERLGKLLTDVARLGLEERSVRLEEEKLALVTAAFKAALSAAGLSMDQQDAIKAEFIRRLSGT